MRLSGVALMTMVVAAQRTAARSASASPARLPPFVRPTKPQATPRKASASPTHWIGLSRSSSKQERRAESDKERRGVDEHRRARGGGEAQQFVKRDEFGGEQGAGQRARGLRAVDLEDAALRRRARTR